MALKDVFVARDVFTVKGRQVQKGDVIHDADEYAEARDFHHHSVVKAKHDFPDEPEVQVRMPVADDHE